MVTKAAEPHKHKTFRLRKWSLCKKVGTDIISLLLVFMMAIGPSVTLSAAQAFETMDSEGCLHNHLGNYDCSFVLGEVCSYIQGVSFGEQISGAGNIHVHDTFCGFVEAVDCDHVHNAFCGGVETADSNAFIFDAAGEANSTGEIGIMSDLIQSDCTHVHGMICGYAEAVECSHEHDASCSGGEGAPNVLMDGCTHIHDLSCGYMETTDCTHEHDASCAGGEVKLPEEIVYGCTHIHGIICGYIETKDCIHEHDDLCGAIEEPDGTVTGCTHIHDTICGYLEAVNCAHEHDKLCGGLGIVSELFGYGDFELFATGDVVITNIMEPVEITNAIQAAVDGTSFGDTIVVTGHKSNVSAVIKLDIRSDVTIEWRAVTEGLSFDINGGGTFEVALGGRITVTNKSAIQVDVGDVIVAGGEIMVLKTVSDTSNERNAVFVKSGNIKVLYGKVSSYGRCNVIAVVCGNITVSGGEISVLRLAAYDLASCNAIYVSEGEVRVTGGKISVNGNSAGICIEFGKIVMTGGEVSAVGTGSWYCYGVRILLDGTATIIGGSISVSGANHNLAIDQEYGCSAYYAGTCIGDYDIWEGIILKVDLLVIPPDYDSSYKGLKSMSGDHESSAAWDTKGTNPKIIYVDSYGDTYEIEWVAPSSEKFPVILMNTNETFSTINEAITVANDHNLTTFTLEIIGDVTESSLVKIESENITIKGQDGAHIVNIPGLPGILLDGAGSLTLGDGTFRNSFTIGNRVEVREGTIIVKDGAVMKSMVLNGSAVTGTLSGGHFIGSDVALTVQGGAKINEISGGVFSGDRCAVFVTDEHTWIGEISGGNFLQTGVGTTSSLQGNALFLDKHSKIDKISDGYFEAVQNSALVVYYGSWIEKISGGVFKSNSIGRRLQNRVDTSSATMLIWSGGIQKTGIGMITGGESKGGYFGILSIDSGSQIQTISEGTFRGKIGLQNDFNSVITEISGGVFDGDNHGILNAGNIKKISGNAYILGRGSGCNGIYNFPGGVIDEINGGMIESKSYIGIANQGTIRLISGGSIIGEYSAISCTTDNIGRLGTITSGVFWGKNRTAITLAYPLILEPDLNRIKGYGRYWGKDGIIFNDESLVEYPKIGQTTDKYWMSVATEAVPDFGDNSNGFKYLMYNLPPGNFYVNVEDSYAIDSGTGPYKEGDTVTINAGVRIGYDFDGWTTNDGVIFGNPKDQTTTFVMPAHDVTVTANWELRHYYYKVTVLNSKAVITGAGAYEAGDKVTINAGLSYNNAFAGWTKTDAGVVFDEFYSPVTTFVMPARDVTVTAIWTLSPGLYIVTVIDSYSEFSGAGGYRHDNAVYLDAGSRSGYQFTHWTTTDGMTFADNNKVMTTFVMPAKNVTVMANWKYYSGEESTNPPPVNPPEDPNEEPSAPPVTPPEEPPVEPPGEPPVEPPVEPAVEPPVAPSVDPQDNNPVTPPGGTDPYAAPAPNPGGTLELTENGTYIEIDENGVPRGEWHWDEDEGMWIFDEYPPRVGLPNTGGVDNTVDSVLLLGFSLFGLCLIMIIAARKLRA